MFLQRNSGIADTQQQADLQLKHALHLQQMHAFSAQQSPLISPQATSPPMACASQPSSIPGSPVHALITDNSQANLTMHLQRLQLQQAQQQQRHGSPVGLTSNAIESPLQTFQRIQSLSMPHRNSPTPGQNSPLMTYSPEMCSSPSCGCNLDSFCRLHSPGSYEPTPTSPSLNRISGLQHRNSPTPPQNLHMIQEDILETGHQDDRLKTTYGNPQISITDELGAVRVSANDSDAQCIDLSMKCREKVELPDLRKTFSGTIKIPLSPDHAPASVEGSENLLLMIKQTLDEHSKESDLSLSYQQGSIAVGNNEGVWLELEVCDGPGPEERGLKMRRLSGDSLKYNELCQNIIAYIELC